MKALIRVPGALSGAEGQRTAAAVDSRPADPDLHRRQLCARLERRPEGHGPDHADPDRHRAHRLCAEPHDARSGRHHFVAVSAQARRRCHALRRRRAGAGRCARRGGQDWSAPARSTAGRAARRWPRSPARSRRGQHLHSLANVPADQVQHAQRHVPGQRGLRFMASAGADLPRPTRTLQALQEGSSTTPPSSSRPGSRSRSRSRSAWAR